MYNMDKFNENLKLLLEQITNVFPEQREHIESIYNFEEPGDKYLSSFYLNCRTMGDDVSSKNEIIFSKENTILDGVNFYEIWNSEKINPDMKKNIWKYLHTLYVYAYEYEKDQDLKTIMKELKKMGGNRDEMDEDTRTLANIIDSLTGKFDKAPEGMEEDTPSGGDEPFSNFAPPELFDGMIGDLAKEIADEINPEELNLDDPSQLLKDLMSGNFDMENDSSGIGNLVKNFRVNVDKLLTLSDASYNISSQDNITIYMSEPTLVVMKPLVIKTSYPGKIDLGSTEFTIISHSLKKKDQEETVELKDNTNINLNDHVYFFLAPKI